MGRRKNRTRSPGLWIAANELPRTGGHPNILKRLLVPTGAFSLGLLLRTLIDVGTPRGLQGRMVAVQTLVVVLWTRIVDRRSYGDTRRVHRPSAFTPYHRFELLPVGASEWTP